MALTLSSVGCVPLADTWGPRYSTDGIMKLHLLRDTWPSGKCTLGLCEGLHICGKQQVLKIGLYWEVSPQS